MMTRTLKHFFHLALTSTKIFKFKYSIYFFTHNKKKMGFLSEICPFSQDMYVNGVPNKLKCQFRCLKTSHHCTPTTRPPHCLFSLSYICNVIFPRNEVHFGHSCVVYVVGMVITYFICTYQIYYRYLELQESNSSL